MDNRFFNSYPYTDFHELNLSWVISELRSFATTLEQFVSINALKYADPIDWNITTQYEKNTIVIDAQTGTAYISVAPVPAGVSLTNTDYWCVVFDLSSFIVRAARNLTDKYEEETTLTATFPSNINDWIVWGDTLYRVTSPIIAGDQYIENSNIISFTVEDVVGHIQTLSTTDKSNIVNSINEIVSHIGDIDELDTTDKSNIVAAVNEIYSELVNIIQIVNNYDCVTPQMYGAIGDGVTDDIAAFNSALATGKPVFVPIGTYRLSATLKIPYMGDIYGLDRFNTILKFDSGVNGVQINHSTTITNLTISISGNAAGVYMYTPDNYRYNIKSKCSDIIINHESDTVDGAAIKLVCEKVGSAPEGAYDGIFEDIYITNNFEYAIYMHGRAHTASFSDCWLTDMLFRNIFVDRARVVIQTDWEDVSSANLVPLTGDGPLFSATFDNVRAQYYSGVSEHFVYSYNLNRGTFINCKAIDYYHAVSDDNHYVYVFNAHTDMSKIYMDSSAMTQTYKWVGFLNTTPNDVAAYNDAFLRCFIILGTLQSYYPEQGGKMPKTYGNFINEHIICKGSDAFTINTNNYATVDNDHAELVISGNTLFFEASLGFTAQPLINQRLGTLATGGIDFTEMYFYGSYGASNSDGTPILMRLQQNGGLFIVDNTNFPSTPAGRLKFSFAVPLFYRTYN